MAARTDPELAQTVVGRSQGHLLEHRAEQRHLLRGRERYFVAVQLADQVAGDRAAVARGGGLHRLVQRGAQLPLDPNQLRLGKTVPQGLGERGLQHAQPLPPFARLDPGGEAGIAEMPEKEAAGHAAAGERTARLPLQLLQAVVEQGRAHVVTELLRLPCARIGLRGDVAHRVQGQAGVAQFRLGLEQDRNPLRPHPADVRARPGRAGGGERGETLAQEVLGLSHRHVADHHDDQVVRPVPVVVIPAQQPAVRGGEHLLGADGVALGHQRAGKIEAQLLLAHPRLRGIAAALLGKDDAALALHFRLAQQPAAGVVGQHLESLGQHLGFAGRQEQVVDRLVEAGVRVGVGAKAHADGLEVFHQGSGRVVGGAVEQHVLEIVGHAPLVVRLVQRSGLHVQIQGHPVARLAVGQEHVAQAVVQSAES